MKIINEYTMQEKVTPRQMDFAWANGWRHFGTYFFRYNVAGKNGDFLHVTPLRIRLSEFRLSTSQKKVLKRNADVAVEARDAFIDAEKIALFERHKTRFRDNVPDSIYSFLGDTPASVPCCTKEICLFLAGRLVGVTFIDIGQIATSGIYAMFNPDEYRRSLGIFMILLSIQFSLKLGKKYYYHGYAYREPSHYDYKKKFNTLEFYDWFGRWQPFQQNALISQRVEG